MSDTPLSESLTQYQAGIREGQRLATTSTSISPDVENAPRLIAALLPEAIRSLAILLVNPETDNVRLGAIKLVFEYSIGKPDSTNKNTNEIDALIKQLQSGTVSQ